MAAQNSIVIRPRWPSPGPTRRRSSAVRRLRSHQSAASAMRHGGVNATSFTIRAACARKVEAHFTAEKRLFPINLLRFCPGSKVSVGEWKLCHTMLLLESLITRLPLLRRATVVCLPDDVLLSHTVEPLVSVSIRLPSWFSDILEPYLFTGE